MSGHMARRAIAWGVAVVGIVVVTVVAAAWDRWQSGYCERWLPGTWRSEAISDRGHLLIGGVLYLHILDGGLYVWAVVDPEKPLARPDPTNDEIGMFERPLVEWCRDPGVVLENRHVLIVEGLRYHRVSNPPEWLVDFEEPPTD